jgi:hypothetical protein
MLQRQKKSNLEITPLERIDRLIATKSLSFSSFRLSMIGPASGFMPIQGRMQL